MTLTTDLVDALRREIAAEMRAQKTALNASTTRRVAELKNQISEVSEELTTVGAKVDSNHVEGLRGFAHVGDQVADLRKLLEPLVEHHARRARRRAHARRVLTSVPALLTLAATIAGTAGALVALF